MSKNNEWAKVKRLTVPGIMKMLDWQTRLDEESGKKIIWLPKTASESIEDWQRSADSYREKGLDNPKAGQKMLLGTHENMSSPGKITLYRENIGRCFWVCVSKLLSTANKITPDDLRHLCEAAVFQVFTHEQFHHYCDAISKITGHRGSSPEEEALAVAWSWHEVQRSLPAAKELSSDLFKASLSWWYDKITALGYKDWKNFSHECSFMDGLVAHLISPSINNTVNGHGDNPGYWLYKLIERPAWCADAVLYSVVDKEVNAHSATNPKTPIALTELKKCLEGMGVLDQNKKELVAVAVEDDLILCGKGIGSLHDIHKMIASIDGFICLKDNPINSSILGLLKIKGLNKVLLDKKAVQEIINKHLPLGDILDCVGELEDAGFEEYAKL